MAGPAESKTAQENFDVHYLLPPYFCHDVRII